MIFYNLFVYFSTKNISFVHYVFFLASILTLLMGMNGFGYQYLYPFSPFLQNEGIPLMGLLVFITCSLFSDSYLNFKEDMPKISIALRLFAYISLAFLIISPIIPYSILLRSTLIYCLCGLVILITGVFLKVKSVIDHLIFIYLLSALLLWEPYLRC